ncbi:hypothetical protein CDAR_550301 [Caerostris darwini]|uniref:Uncharacterized protein n=1 Tax=Caerostris darwini TaxID=1538125 RepID=A0AAV4XAL5_9ARAC|nr:hypothetical protein CDAR_550301 [Caerostris darwini]
MSVDINNPWLPSNGPLRKLNRPIKTIPTRDSKSKGMRNINRKDGYIERSYTEQSNTIHPNGDGIESTEVGHRVLESLFYFRRMAKLSTESKLRMAKLSTESKLRMAKLSTESKLRMAKLFR